MHHPHEKKRSIKLWLIALAVLMLIPLLIGSYVVFATLMYVKAESSMFKAGLPDPPTKDEIPILIDKLKNGEIEFDGVETYRLSTVDDNPLVRNGVMDALGSSNPDARLSAVKILGFFNKLPKGVLTELIDTLNDENGEIRSQAAWAIGCHGKKTGHVVPALTAVLDDEYWRVRYNASFALGEIGPEARMALPKLRELAENDPYLDEDFNSYTVRGVAKTAIKRIEGER